MSGSARNEALTGRLAPDPLARQLEHVFMHPGEQGSKEMTASVRAAYEAFNRRDWASAVALMCEDVDWHDTLRGERRRGRLAVHRYWAGLASLFSPRVELLAVRATRKQQVVVDAHLLIHDRQGTLLAFQDVRHIFSFRGALIARMDAFGPAPAPAKCRTEG